MEDPLTTEYSKEFVKLGIFWTATWEEFMELISTKPNPPQGQLSFEL